MDFSSNSFGAILPQEHYKECLKLDSRPDGRELGEFRELTVNVGSIGTAHGSSLVQLGDTMVVCGVKGELMKPPPSEPEKGVIVPNVELSPMCASHFKPGPPSEQAQVTSQFLQEIIKTCHVINLEDLCLCKSKLAWVLYCDIVCLNYDGNINDACVLAMVAALQNTTLPEVTYDDEHDTTETAPDSKDGCKLNVKKIVSSTFTQFESKYLIADPGWKEEQVTSGEVTIVTDDKERVCYMHRPGGAPMQGNQLEKCISAATKNGKRLHLVLDKISKKP